MQREQFAQVRALFDAVCDLDEPLRRARLHELSDDADAIAKVLALLDRTEMNVWQIVEPALKSLAASGGEVQVGDCLGNWTLLSQIGHGGMGTVYRAQRNDGHFEQIAAIKLLLGIPSSEALERLAQERQILARLSHPNIARLLDGGATPSGQPYIVMDYVEGMPIDDYLRQHGLGIPELLRLLIAVADAVSFAHQRLIVHCDLKPGNILVDAQGRPVLLDFGIASLIDDRGLPVATPDDRMSLAFTPGYASPEQRAGGEVSTATDVYGLGRVLWHLLQSGRTSVSPRPTTDSWDALAVDDPGNVAVPRALRAIVKRATANDPAQRYISVSAFADDLRRFLERQPVAAMGAQRGYLLACYLRRNALVLSLAAITTLALLGGLLGTWLSLRDARLQRQQAQVAGARAERTAEFLGNLLSAADPDQARNLDTRLVRLLLDDAARNAQKELADEPLVLAQISAVIGKTYHQISEYALAQQYLQQALDLLPPERVRERLAVRQKIALALGGHGQTPLALQHYEAIFREREQAFGADDPDTLESAHALAFQWTDSGDFARALEASSALQPRLERLLGSDHETTLANLQTLAIARTELGQFDAAEETLQSLLQRRLRVNGELNSLTIAVQTSLAILYLRQQRFAQAEALLRGLLPKAEQRFGNLSFAAINFASLLGSALRLGGKLDESRPYYRLALERATQAWGADNTRTLNYELNYANLEVASGQADPALQRLARIEPALTTSLGAESPSMAELERTRARALTALGRSTAARQAWQRALAIDRKVFGDDTHPQIVEDLAGIAALKDD
jgi:serine/threonine-protein kinase